MLVPNWVKPRLAEHGQLAKNFDLDQFVQTFDQLAH